MVKRSLLDIFHSIGNVLMFTSEKRPTRVKLTFPPDKTVVEAFVEMQLHNFNQVPVKEGSEVLGVFSYKSFIEGMIKLPENRQNPLILHVEEFVEDLKYAQSTDIPSDLLTEFEIKDAVLVGSENECRGIITTIDTLRSFHSVASPFVFLREIELSIRELIKESVNATELKLCIDKSIKKYYEEKRSIVPKSLKELSFNDLVMILRFKGTWKKFSPIFGMSSDLVYTRLKSLPDIRNDVVHYRRDLTEKELDNLRYVRNWLIRRIRKLEAKERN